MRLSDENIRGRTVVASDKQEVGEISALLIDTDAWRVTSLEVKLRADVADLLGVHRTVFHAGSIEIPVRLIRSAGDTVSLSVPVDELRSVRAGETEPASRQYVFHDDHYPPLITPRSPSYERSQREFLHPSPTGGTQVIGVLAQLCDAEQNASEACSRIAELLTLESLATQLRNDAATHQARRQALGKLIEALGGSPPEPEACREILSRAATAVAGAHSDVDAIHALRVMREELGAAYDEAIRSPSLNDAQRASLAGLAPSVRAR